MKFCETPLERLSKPERNILELAAHIIKSVPHSLDCSLFPDGIRKLATLVYQQVLDLNTESDDHNVRALKLEHLLRNSFERHHLNLERFKWCYVVGSDPADLPNSMNKIRQALEDLNPVYVSTCDDSPTGSLSNRSLTFSSSLKIEKDPNNQTFEINHDWQAGYNQDGFEGNKVLLNLQKLLGMRFERYFSNAYESADTLSKRNSQNLFPTYWEADKAFRNTSLQQGIAHEELTIPVYNWEHDMGAAPIFSFSIPGLDKDSALKIIHAICEADIQK